MIQLDLSVLPRDGRPPTQCQLILKHMIYFGGITVLEAAQPPILCYNLKARIHELREIMEVDGYWVKVGKKKQVMKYHLPVEASNG
jgi:hypothetical protein